MVANVSLNPPQLFALGLPGAPADKPPNAFLGGVLIPITLQRAIQESLDKSGLRPGDLGSLQLTMLQLEELLKYNMSRKDGPQIASTLEQLQSTTRAAMTVALYLLQQLGLQQTALLTELRAGRLTQQEFRTRVEIINQKINAVQTKITDLRVREQTQLQILSVETGINNIDAQRQRLRNTWAGFVAASKAFDEIFATRELEIKNIEQSAENSQVSNLTSLQNSQQKARESSNAMMLSLYKTPQGKAAAIEEAKKNGGLILPPRVIRCLDIDPKAREFILNTSNRRLTPEEQMQKESLELKQGNTCPANPVIELTDEQRLAFVTWLNPLATAPTLKIDPEVQQAIQPSAHDYKPGSNLDYYRQQAAQAIGKFKDKLDPKDYEKFDQGLFNQRRALYQLITTKEGKPELKLDPAALAVMSELDKSILEFYDMPRTPTPFSSKNGEDIFKAIQKGIYEHILNQSDPPPELKRYASEWMRVVENSVEYARNFPRERAGFLLTLDVITQLSSMMEGGKYKSPAAWAGLLKTAGVGGWELFKDNSANAQGGVSRQIPATYALMAYIVEDMKVAYQDLNIALAKRENIQQEILSQALVSRTDNLIHQTKLGWDQLLLLKANVMKHLSDQGASKIVLAQAEADFNILQAQYEANLAQLNYGKRVAEQRLNLTTTQGKSAYSDAKRIQYVNAVLAWNEQAFDTYGDSDFPALANITKTFGGLVVPLGETPEKAWALFVQMYPGLGLPDKLPVGYDGIDNGIARGMQQMTTGINSPEGPLSPNNGVAQNLYPGNGDNSGKRTNPLRSLINVPSSGLPAPERPPDRNYTEY